MGRSFQSVRQGVKASLTAGNGQLNDTSAGREWTGLPRDIRARDLWDAMIR